MRLEPGEVHSRYRVDGPLGAGAMADVYRVTHVELGVARAVKLLKPELTFLHDRLVREGRAQASLIHPNVVPVVELIRVAGRPALVMEYVDGITLHDIIVAGGLGFEQIDALGRGILDGVMAAHERGIVHRDLKPSNVMIDLAGKRPVARVTDFGLAKVLAATSQADMGGTGTGMNFGTPLYMSPEQFRDAKGVDERTDVWALGALLYELITGVPAFPGDDPVSILLRVNAGDFRPVDHLVPEAPSRFVLAIDEALHVDRDERCPSVEALRELWVGDAHARPRPVWDMGSLRSMRTNQSATLPPPNSGYSLSSGAGETVRPWTDEVRIDRPGGDAATGEIDWQRRDRTALRWGVGVSVVGFAVLVGLGALLAFFAVAGIAAVGSVASSPTETAYLGLQNVNGSLVGVGPISGTPRVQHYVVTHEGSRVSSIRRVNAAGHVDPEPGMDVQLRPRVGWSISGTQVEIVRDKQGRAERLVYRDHRDNVVVEARNEVQTDGSYLVRHHNADGMLIRSPASNVFVERVSLGANGRPSEIRFLDRKGTAPLMARDGCFGRQWIYDAEDRVERTTCLGIDGQPAVPIGGGAPVVLNRYDPVNPHLIFEQTGRALDGTTPMRLAPAEPTVTERRTHDSSGRVVRSDDLDAANNPFIGQDNCQAWLFSYGEWDQATCVGPAEQPRISSSGIATVRMVRDAAGRVAAVSAHGPDGEAIASNGVHRIEVRRDPATGETLGVGPFFDIDGRPTLLRGVGRIDLERDDRGRVVVSRSFDAQGQPAPDPEGRAITRATWVGPDQIGEVCSFNPPTDEAGGGADRPSLDSHGRHCELSSWRGPNEVESRTYLGVDRQPTLTDEGFARETYEVDAAGRELRYAVWGTGTSQPVNNTRGWHRRETEYDERGLVAELRYYGNDNRPAIDSDTGFHQIRRRYSPDGQVVEERGFGPGGADDPIIGADGYHQRITEFDRGIEVSRAHYGPERAEVLGRDRKAPCHRVEREIDDRGRIEAETCIGIDGPGAFSSGVTRIERDHDTAGRQTATRATRLDGTPDVERNGTHRTTWTYDDQSRTVTERHFGIEDQPVDVRDLGYSIKTIEDDTLGREVARSYRTAAGEPARALNLASAIHDIEPGERVYSEYRVQRGAAGRVESAELVPADPSTTDPISIRFTHDAVGNPTSARLRGPDGSLVAVGGVAGWDREWHATGREIRQTWVGVDETPVNGPDGCAIIARELDDSGRDATVQITDQQGMELPSCGRTEAGTYSHDARGRVTQTCRAGRGCRVQTFDDRGNVIRIRYEDADGQLITSWKGGAAQVDLEYDAWDRQVRLRFFDRIGNPVVHDPVGAAEWTQTYDRAGRRFETRFLDRRGQPMKGPGGCAVERRTYGTDGVEVLACEPG